MTPHDDLFDRIRATLGAGFDELTGWEPTTTPDGTIAWRARPTWTGGPTEIVFFLNDVKAWEAYIHQTDDSYVAPGEDDTVLVSASLHGGRVKYALHDGDDWWTTAPMWGGNPTSN